MKTRKIILTTLLAAAMLLTMAATAMAEGIIISPQSARISETVVDGAVVIKKKETVKIGRESEDGLTMNLFTLSGVLGQLEEGYTMAAAKEPLPTFVCASDFEVTFLEDATKESSVKAVEWKEGVHDSATMTYIPEGYNQTKSYSLDGEKFINPNDGNTIFKINAFWGNSFEEVVVVVDDSFVPEAKEETPAQPAEDANEPEKESVLARYTQATVMIDGAPVAFEAYNIHDNNYFKLRDIAMALSGTESEFAVDWYPDSPIPISIGIYDSYNPVGGELVKGDGADKMAIVSQLLMNMPDDGNFGGSPFTAYNINGNNYFKLRELAAFLNGTNAQFDVTWDGINNWILIDTNKPYTED